MSRSDLAFSLLVEESFTMNITQPERRQLSVELLCIVAKILSRNPELRFKDMLNLDQLLEQAFYMYCKEKQLPASKDLSPLYSLSYSETTGYLARAAVNTILSGGVLAMDDDAHDFEEETCRVS